MARNRMLNPEFWLDEEVAQLSAHARLLYMGLWGICDDNYATLPNMPGWIKAQIFPYEEVDTKKLLKELQEVGKIIIFKVEEKEYWHIKNFFKYQKVDRPSNPKYPKFKAEYQVLAEYSPSTRPEVKLSKDKLREDKLSKEGGEQVATPSQETKLFFNEVSLLKENKPAPRLENLITNLTTTKNVSYEEVLKEIIKFSSYWQEKNKSGTKEKWELERTFEVSRRLGTWFQNVNKFKGQKQKQSIPVIL